MEYYCRQTSHSLWIKINGNISASEVTLGGSSKGNINSDIVKVKSTADVDGVLNQKSLDRGAKLKIKAETY